MDNHTENNNKAKRIAQKVIKILGQSIAWMLVQLVVLVLLGMVELSPAGIIFYLLHLRVGRFDGIVYNIACILIGMVYTLIGTIVCNTVKINSKTWWLTVSTLYLIYMIVTCVGMMHDMGEWFYEGYGFLILDVWLAPLLWLGELELWHHFMEKLKRRKKKTILLR